MRQSTSLRLLTMAITLLLLNAGLPPGNTPTAAAPLQGGGTQFWSIAGTGFVSANSANTYAYQSGGGVALTVLGGPPTWPFMTAPLELPNGALLDSLVLYYGDTDNTAAITLSLLRYNRTGGAETLASVSSIDDGTSSRTTSAIANPTVDNSTYSYALAAEIDSAPLILYGARIGYSPPVWPAAASASLAPAAGDRPSAGPPAADPAATNARGPQPRANLTGGQVAPLAVRSANAGVAAGPNPLAVGNPVHWRHYTVPGSTFHAAYSGTGNAPTDAGGRFMTSAATGQGSLAAPLDLIDGQTIRGVKFTYYNDSATNPRLLLYRVDRQGGLTLLWDYTPVASGATFVASSPPMSEVVDNAAYAYFFMMLTDDPAVGADLVALQVKIEYVSNTSLPLILKNY